MCVLCMVFVVCVCIIVWCLLVVSFFRFWLLSVVVPCLLFVVGAIRCSLFVVGFPMSVVCCMMFVVVRWLLFVVRCFVVRCLLLVGCLLLSVVC